MSIKHLEVVLITKAIILSKPDASEIREYLEFDAKPREFPEVQSMIWNRSDDSFIEAISSFGIGDGVYTDSLKVFGPTQEDVRQTLADLIFYEKIRVFLDIETDIIEVTTEPWNF